MAQAGIHGLVGLILRKWAPHWEWLILGLVLGNLLPDADNLAVAIATVAKLPTEGLHRTFSHSLFTVVVIYLLFYLIAATTHQHRWANLGLGLSLGVFLHILLDLLIWFNGVAILWPIPSWVNLWAHIKPPDWWDKLMLPMEFLFFALFFWGLAIMAQRRDTDRDFLDALRVWTMAQVVLFVVFTVLVYIMRQGFMTIYGIGYLLSLGLAFWVAIRMRKTVEAITKLT